MSRQSQQEVAAAARRRLELLGRELEQAGLRRVDDVSPPADRIDSVDPADPGDPWGTVPPWAHDERDHLDAVAPVRAGRHARVPVSASAARRLAGQAGELLPDSVRGRVGLAPPAVLLVVSLVALAAVATAVAVVRMGGGSQPVGAARAGSPLVPLASVSPSPAASTRPAPSTTAGASAGASPTGTVTVDVAGKVRRPGVATLPVGARVIDALRRAGGARTGVDLSALNLARVLVDGEQILVGRPARATGRLAASAAAAAPAPTGALVNLNTATAEQLDTLPGIGPVTAQKILAWRAAHGAFSSVDELLEVDGIGEKTLADLAPMVTL